MCQFRKGIHELAAVLMVVLNGFWPTLVHLVHLPFRFVRLATIRIARRPPYRVRMRGGPENRRARLQRLGIFSDPQL
jgi:hypothetical protein